jgi:hypothetical protein
MSGKARRAHTCSKIFFTVVAGDQDYSFNNSDINTPYSFTFGCIVARLNVIDFGGKN